MFVKNVGYLCYSAHQLSNPFLAYFPTGNSLLKLEIFVESQWPTGLSAGDGLQIISAA